MSRAVPRYRRPNPTLPAVAANLFQVNLQGQIESQMTLNTFYFWDNNAALGVASEANCILNFTTNHLPNIKLALCQDWTIVQISCQCINVPTRIRVVNVSFAGQAGARAAGHEPTQVAACLTRQTAFRGQCGRGRLYFPGIATLDVVNSTLTAASKALFDAIGNDLITDHIVAGTTFTSYLYSKGSRTSKVVGAAKITAVITRTLCATIRRRRIGKGK